MELLTLERTESLQDWDLVQIIDGIEFEMPSPFTKHQKISRILQRFLENFITERNLGEIYYAPCDVIFQEHINRVQPDLIYISNENNHIIQDFIRGVPDLLVEIVSKSTFYTDTEKKKELYERFGVKEYWIVFPEYQSIEVFTLENGKYKTYSQGFDDDIVKSKLLEGFEVKPSQII
jgi:Uma2 family endonuclease